MRQLKVRVWDKRHIEDGNSTFLIRDLLYMEGITSIENMEHKIVDEFTGLLDKEGVEIYEGDIVKYISTSRFDEEDTIIDSVEYVDGSFYPLPINSICEDDFYSIYITDYEVIGNIYENKELLKTAK